MKRSMEERLADLQKRKQQLVEQEKLLKTRMSQEDRKKRTRRLIEEGAIFEQYLGIKDKADAEEVCKYIISHQGIKIAIDMIIKGEKSTQDHIKGPESF